MTRLPVSPVPVERLHLPHRETRQGKREMKIKHTFSLVCMLSVITTLFLAAQSVRVATQLEKFPRSGFTQFEQKPARRASHLGPQSFMPSTTAVHTFLAQKIPFDTGHRSALHERRSRHRDASCSSPAAITRRRQLQPGTHKWTRKSFPEVKIRRGRKS